MSHHQHHHAHHEAHKQSHEGGHKDVHVHFETGKREHAAADTDAVSSPKRHQHHGTESEADPAGPGAATVPSKTFTSLTNVVLGDVLPHHRREIITLVHNQSIHDAMKTLSKNHILSAPVVMSASIEDDMETADQYLGMVDVLNLLQGVLREFAAHPSIKTLPPAEQWAKFEQMGHEFADRIVYTITNSNDVDLLWKGNIDQPLLTVIREAFLRPAESGSHVQRIALFGTSQRIVNIVSQSDIVRFLQAHKHLVPVADRPIRELGLGTVGVVAVSKTTPAIDAFRTMAEHNVTAVAVLDGDRLYSNLSASDLRGLTPDDFTYLVKPVEHFLLLEKSHPSTLARLPKPITCTMDETFATVLDRLVEHHIHRLYVVDERQRPLGVVTLTDVLRVVVDAVQSKPQDDGAAAVADGAPKNE